MGFARLVPSHPLSEDVKRVANALDKSYSAVTSATPDVWYYENPKKGHADIASVMIAEKCGGLIFKGLSIDGKIIHYWNLLPGNYRYDETLDQYSYKPKWKFSRRVPIKALLCDIGLKRRLLTFRSTFDNFYVDL